jgi:hypothetical protein
VRTDLRPLSIGEMLDRAVTLSVRSFVPLALIWAVYLVPLSIVGYFGLAGAMKTFAAIITAASHGATLEPNSMQTLAAVNQFNALTALYYGVFIFVQPLCTAALLRATSDAYLGPGAPSLGVSYRDGLRQWLPLIGIVLIWIAVGALAYVALVLAAVILALGIGGLIALTKGFGIVVALVVGTIVFVAVIVAFAVCFLSFQVACTTQVVEDVGFVRAFSSGLRRVFGQTLARSAACALALAAVYAGAAFVGIVAQSVFVGFLHSVALGIGFSALLQIVMSVFIAAATIVYYYDIRVRTEALDLQLAAVP